MQTIIINFLKDDTKMEPVLGKKKADLDEGESSCLFCYENIKNKIVKEFNSVVAIKDQFPVSPGHMLIIPKRHCRDLFQMTSDELMDTYSLLSILKNEISKKDNLVTGYNVGVNVGASAGQTVFHCHFHLIPRREGDTPNPRGGVRGVIPGKMNY